MPPIQVNIENEHQPELDLLLSSHIYAFNCETTGIANGKALNATVKDEEANIVAAISGYTWGGCCEVVNLWVAESLRGEGYGSALLRAAEQEAIRRGCHQIVLTTHSFQAPLFYEKHAYQRLSAVPNYPRGYEKITYIKQLE